MDRKSSLNVQTEWENEMDRCRMACELLIDQAWSMLRMFGC